MSASWEAAVLHHISSSAGGGVGLGPSYPPFVEERLSCPVCGRDTGCRCYPRGWDADDAAYLASWHARVDAGAFEVVEAANG